ncbi:MAG: hypothetical protein AAF583_03535 [Pseudomonadota bacterium]
MIIGVLAAITASQAFFWVISRPIDSFRDEVQRITSELEQSGRGRIIATDTRKVPYAPITWFYPHTTGLHILIPVSGHLGPSGYYFQLASLTEKAGWSDNQLATADCDHRDGHSAKTYSTDPYFNKFPDLPRNIFGEEVFPGMNFNEIRYNTSEHKASLRSLASIICSHDWHDRS